MPNKPRDPTRNSALVRGGVRPMKMATDMSIRFERCQLVLTLVGCTTVATMGAAGALFREKTVLGWSLCAVFALCALGPAWRIIQPDDWLMRRSARSTSKDEKQVEPEGAGSDSQARRT